MCSRAHPSRLQAVARDGQSGHTKVAVMHLACNGSQERLGVMTALVPSLLLVAVINRRELRLGADTHLACSHTMKPVVPDTRLTLKGAFPCVYDISLHCPANSPSPSSCCQPPRLPRQPPSPPLLSTLP